MSPAFHPLLAWGGYGPSSGRATASRFPSARPQFLITPPPLVGSEPTRYRSIPTPTSKDAYPLTTATTATAPPTAGTHPATGSTTEVGTRSDGSFARSDTAPGSTPRRMSRTPSAAATASPLGASPPTGDAPAATTPTTPSGSTPASPSPCTPSCSPGRPP